MTVTNVKLRWILTQYGKNRINQLLTNPDDKVQISIMHIGRDGSGEPQERETADGSGRLYDPINVNIPIVEKGISSERENTVYFKAMINENMCGYDIAELALYENINGQEKMFAVGVGQAIPKPDIKYGYLMSIEYTLYIESTNLLEVYDQIVLDPNNEFLKQTDVDTLYRTILYVEGNLAEQIGKNTHQIGLSRAKELNDLISETRLKYNSASVASYYSSMANSVEDLKNIIGFWSFNYTDTYGTAMNIKDFSTWENYFSTNALLSSYYQEYLGVLSSLKFGKDDYFYANTVPYVTSSVSSVKLGQLINHELTDHMTFSPDSKLWLYKSVYYNEDYVKENFFKYYLKGNVALTDNDNSQMELGELGSDAFGTMYWRYIDTSAQGEISGKWVCDDLNLTYDIGTFKGKVINYSDDISKQPHNNARIYIFAKPGVVSKTSSTITSLGNVVQTCPAPSSWQYYASNNRWVWENDENMSLYYSDEDFRTHVVNYEGTATNGDIINVRMANPDQVVKVTFTNKQFDLLQYKTVNGRSVPFDSPFTYIASLKHNEMNNRNTLLAQSSYFSGKHNFEIAKTEDNAIEVSLFSTLESSKISWKTLPNSVPPSAYNVIVTYNPNYDDLGKLNPVVKVYINNKACTVTNITPNSTYSGMKENLMNTTSYVEDTNKNKTFPIDAQVCLMALIKEEFDFYIARCNSLILNSLSGKNVYYKV